MIKLKIRKGKQAGRGTKGQKARSGVAIKGFEGGQMPIIARLPKRGFNPLRRFRYDILKLEVVNYLLKSEVIQSGQLIDNLFLAEIGIIKSPNKSVKLLGNEKLISKVSFDLDAYSEAAKTSVLEAGGEIK